MKQTGSKVISKILHEYGVSHVFYQDAILRKSLKDADEIYGIKGIMTHSEGAAGCMADGYARSSGGPGVCMAQSIGAANLTGGLMDAWLSTTPVVAITGKKAPLYQHRNSYQETQHHELFENVTKFQAEVINLSEQLPFLLHQCFRESVSGKPRPVHLDVIGRDGVETDAAEIGMDLAAEPVYSKVPPYRPFADQSLVLMAAKELEKAEKPLIIAGRGALRSDAGAAILALAEKGGIAITTTPDAKTLIDEESPLWGGIIGNYGMNCTNRMAQKADVVLYIGTQTSDQVTLDWTAPAMDKRVIQIDIAPEELGRSYPNSIGLCGDARTVVEQLGKVVKEKSNFVWLREVSEALTATNLALDAHATKETARIHPAILVKELQKALPKDAALVVDTGYTAIWASTMMRLKPTQRFYRATGSLGWSYPGSLGVKCGAPERPVVCLTGDGGFYGYMAEMETQMRYNIKTVTVIDNNRILSSCVPQTEAVYGDKAAEGIKKIRFTNVSFAKIASDFGLYSECVEEAADIVPAIQRALASDRPAVIEVMTESIPHLPAIW